MINIESLQTVDNLAYDLDDIKNSINREEFEAFTKWLERRSTYLSTQGKKCILAGDLQLYIRLRTNALKKK